MKEFLMPDIGEGIVECEIQRWLVNEGDFVVEDQAVAEVLTDKAAVEISSMYQGTINKLHYAEGDLAKVHSPLFSIIESDDSSAGVSEHTEKQVDTKPVEASTETTTNATNNSHTPFILPDIGEGVTECEVLNWQVSVGDMVAEDQVVVEVSTDKAIVEIPAKYNGIITNLAVAAGSIAKVGEPLYFQQLTDLQDASEESSPMQVQSERKIAPAPSTITTEKVNNNKAIASPAVRRIAREQNIDLSQVVGSGEKGRILKQDLNTFNDSNTALTSVIEQPVALNTDKSTTSASQGRYPQTSEFRVEKMTRVQQMMAAQMQRSVSTIPHFTVSDDVEMDALMALRSQLKPELAAQGHKLSVMPLFIKTLSLAMKAFPIVNGRVAASGNDIEYHASHNIGFAVDSPVGLVVPNIKGVNNLSLLEIAMQFNQLVDEARQGKLKPDSMKNGTITLSNIGVLGGTTATPIINHPESAIAALGKVQRLPRFDEQGNVVAKHIMNVSWSGDHRLLDGATMVRFNNEWKRLIEQPQLMLTAMI